MFVLNANLIAPLVFAVIYGSSTYRSARRVGVPIAPAMASAIRMTAGLAVLSILYGLALNALRIPWNSLPGYGLGLAFGLVGLAFIIASQKWQRLRRHWK